MSTQVTGPGGDETTRELLQRARDGDDTALNKLFQRYLPPLLRWASGRLPAHARESLDTGDVVQDVLLRSLSQLDGIQAAREGQFLGYLRVAVINRIRDEHRKRERVPARTEFPLDGVVAQGPSPLEEALGAEVLARYEAALARLRPTDREAIIARVEMNLPYAQIADALDKPSVESAQMAVGRALVRLAREMDLVRPQGFEAGSEGR